MAIITKVVSNSSGQTLKIESKLEIQRVPVNLSGTTAGDTGEALVYNGSAMVLDEVSGGPGGDIFLIDGGIADDSEFHYSQRDDFTTTPSGATN